MKNGGICTRNYEGIDWDELVTRFPSPFALRLNGARMTNNGTLMLNGARMTNNGTLMLNEERMTEGTCHPREQLFLLVILTSTTFFTVILTSMARWESRSLQNL
jgi:hypothetical protein